MILGSFTRLSCDTESTPGPVSGPPLRVVVERERAALTNGTAPQLVSAPFVNQTTVFVGIDNRWRRVAHIAPEPMEGSQNYTFADGNTPG